MQLFPFPKVKLSVTPCILRLIGLRNSQAQAKHSLALIAVLLCLRVCSSPTASAHHSGSLIVAISDRVLNGHKVKERVNVCHYVICATTVQ